MECVPNQSGFIQGGCKNGGKTGAATRRPVLTRSDEVQLEKKYFEWLADWK